MSQPTDSPAPNGTTQYKSALEEYHAKAASGYFKPATIDTVPGMSLANVRGANFPVLPVPAAPANYQHSAPPPPPTVPAATTTTPAPSVISYSPYGVLTQSAAATAPATTAATPSTAYSPYSSLPPTPTPRVTFSGHQPNLLPRHNQTHSYGPFPGYQLPQLQPRQNVFVPTPDSITFEHIAVRLEFLLEPNLTNWLPQQVVLLSTTLTKQIITLGKNRDLGPDGIGSVNDIFMAAGHEGKWQYMTLAVVAPIAVKVLLRGPSYFLDGRNPLEDEASMEILRGGFRDVAGQEWGKANEQIGRGGRR